MTIKPKSPAQLMWERLAAMQDRRDLIPDGYRQLYEWTTVFKCNAASLRKMLKIGEQRGFVVTDHFYVFKNHRMKRRKFFKILTNDVNDLTE